MFDLRAVKSTDEIRQVAIMAHEIWNQHFVRIIGQEQVDYMLREFQSPSAIVSQIAQGYEYYLACSIEGESFDNLGYLGLVPTEESGRIMISKIYVREQNRGSGVGNFLMDQVKQLAVERNLKTIWLTVNRFNHDTVDWYKRKGFMIVDLVKKDIGEGFFMDDYIMELTFD